ncbi:MAG: hypothetical protein WC392_14460 [Sulfuricella sp.]|jgi:hypothetical protein
MNTSTQARGIRVWAISLAAAGFGQLTIRKGGAVLFGDEAARAAAAALCLGLALAAGAGPSLASSTTTAPMTLGAAPQSRPDFSGQWVLNAKASDDPQEKIREAMKTLQQAKGGGPGMGGGGRGGGMGGGGMGGGGMGGGGMGGGGMGGGMSGGRQGRGSPDAMGGRGEKPSGELSALMVTAEKLDISHEDPMLLITDENGQRQRLFTDFRGASVSASGGLQQRVSIAGWENAALVVESTMPGGSRRVQNYQIDASTGQLMIITAVSLPEKQAVSYQLVYDRVKPGTNTVQ